MRTRRHVLLYYLEDVFLVQKNAEESHKLGPIR